MPKINLELNRDDAKLKLDGNISSSTLKELRKIINYDKNNQHAIFSSDSNQNYNDFCDIEYTFDEVSPRLRNNKDFQKLIIKIFEEYEEHYTESIRVNNILELKLRNNKVIKELSLNQNQWKKQSQTLFGNINKNSVDFSIIHVAGLTNDNQIEIVIDPITNNMFDIPTKIIKSKYSSDNTLVEVVFFGSNIRKYYFSEFNDDF